MLKVTVIIPVRKNESGLEKCVQCLEKQSVGKEAFDVIIVYNQKVLPRRFYKSEIDIKYLHEKNEINSYAARNLAIRNANGRIIAFTDSDCEPDKEWIKYALEHFQSNSNCNILAGGIAFLFSKRKKVSELIDAKLHLAQKQKVLEKQNATTANLFVKKEVFSNTGLFPSVKSGGDTIFSIIAVNKAYKIEYEESVLVFHPARGFKSLIKKRFRLGVGFPATTYFRKQCSVYKTMASVSKQFLKNLFPSLIIIDSRNLYYVGIGLLVLWLCRLTSNIGIVYGMFLLLGNEHNYFQRMR